MITKSKENNLENLITILADYYQVDPKKSSQESESLK